MLGSVHSDRNKLRLARAARVFKNNVRPRQGLRTGAADAGVHPAAVLAVPNSPLVPAEGALGREFVPLVVFRLIDCKFQSLRGRRALHVVIHIEREMRGGRIRRHAAPPKSMRERGGSAYEELGGLAIECRRGDSLFHPVNSVSTCTRTSGARVPTRHVLNMGERSGSGGGGSRDSQQQEQQKKGGFCSFKHELHFSGRLVPCRM